MSLVAVQQSSHHRSRVASGTQHPDLTALLLAAKRAHDAVVRHHLPVPSWERPAVAPSPHVEKDVEMLAFGTVSFIQHSMRRGIAAQGRGK